MWLNIFTMGLGLAVALAVVAEAATVPIGKR
jgi:hypothetical protein